MDLLKYDNRDQVNVKVNKLKKSFATHKTKDIDYRLKQLKTLKAAVNKYETQMDEANKKDLGHSSFVSFYLNHSNVTREIDTMISHLHEWSSPRYMETPSVFIPSTSYVTAEPHGVVLIMGAWNFNYNLTIVPMATAICAGNAVLVKPSEMAPYSALIIEKICAELDQDLVQVCHGERETCEALLDNQFDLIFFTGSPMKGRLVAAAAAKFLTPCILELGGQNPCIVDKTASITNAAHNLVNGRFINSGQVCLSPEYVFVEASLIDQLIEEMKKTVKTFYTDNPKQSEDYQRVINTWHAERISELVKQPGEGAKIIIGGDFDIQERYVAPCIIRFDNIATMGKSNVAKEEIFGPIIYLVPYTDLNNAIDYINSRDKPLVLYYFGSDSTNLDNIIKKTSSGAVLTNDTVIHFTNEFLPFGGVGVSGYGAYHGKWGFDALSHLKPVMVRNSMLMGIRYPPFKSNAGIMKFLMNNLTWTQSSVYRAIIYLILVILVIVFRSRIISAGQHLYSQLV